MASNAYEMLYKCVFDPNYVLIRRLMEKMLIAFDKLDFLFVALVEELRLG